VPVAFAACSLNVCASVAVFFTCWHAGCEAPYVDPKTHLRYANTEAFKIARSLTEDEVQARLGIRNAQSVLK
jgi:INO80 complex subunit C